MERPRILLSGCAEGWETEQMAYRRPNTAEGSFLFAWFLRRRGGPR